MKNIVRKNIKKNKTFQQALVHTLSQAMSFVTHSCTVYIKS